MTILQLGQRSHILEFTDSLSALGWMHKAYFDPVNTESHNAVARWLGWTLVNNKTYLYSQHIKGTENIIADSLSMDFHKSDQTLTNIFNQILPQQTAVLFHIKHLPSNIISWISLIAVASTLPTASPKLLQPSSLATGKGGEHSPNTQESQTNSWKEYHKNRKQSWCHHSPPQCDETNSEKRGNMYSSTELTSPPYRIYLRPSGRTFGATQP